MPKAFQLGTDGDIADYLAIVKRENAAMLAPKSPATPAAPIAAVPELVAPQPPPKKSRKTKKHEIQ